MVRDSRGGGTPGDQYRDILHTRTPRLMQNQGVHCVVPPLCKHLLGAALNWQAVLRTDQGGDPVLEAPGVAGGHSKGQFLGSI